jgi:K+-transporting ATPase ATPase A chain
MSGWLQVAAVLLVIAAVHVPLGNYLARTFTGRRHLRVETVLYRVMRVDPDADQRWTTYAGSLLAFSALSTLLLYGLLRLQSHLPLSLGRPGMAPAQAFNTAVSFVSNTSWQSYAGESTLGHLTQLAGITVQSFLSAACGLAVALVLIRGLVRRNTDRLGNFWCDLVRATVRVLLPLSVLFAAVLLAGGVIENLHGFQDVSTLAGHAQAVPGGPVASQEAIKLMSGDGGGFYNASSAHPFENPTGWTNLVEIILMLLVPSAMPRMYGRMVGDTRQGWLLVGVMTVLFSLSLGVISWVEAAHPGTVPAAVGSATEGTEARFGPSSTVLFANTATATADGAVNGSLDSLPALGGGVALVNMLLGEISPGGIGSGLYGLVALALMAVFLGGLMIGRTPEYLGKQIRSAEIRLVALITLATPLVVLVGTALALGLKNPPHSFLNAGSHGLSEGFYAFSSAGNTNGSAFAGLGANTDFYNVALALVMAAGRFLPMVLVLALAGTLAGQGRVPSTRGTLPTHTATFAGLTVGVALIVVGLEYLPALALGPLAEGLT